MNAFVSLAGAGLPQGWRPDPDTEYFHLAYRNDLLMYVQDFGGVWEGSVPQGHEAFEQGEPLSRPDATHEWALSDQGDLVAVPVGEGTLAHPIDVAVSGREDHELIASDAQENRQALEHLLRAVK